MSYDFQKDKQEVVDYWVRKYGSMDKAIFEMNGHILDLRATVEGMQAYQAGEFDDR